MDSGEEINVRLRLNEHNLHTVDVVRLQCCQQLYTTVLPLHASLLQNRIS